MDTNANIITNMGIISDKVYNQEKGKDYFQIGAKLTANNTTYKVLDHTGDWSLNGFQALLLEELKTDQNGNVLKDTNGKDLTTGNYVIAFRGTDSILDGLVDLAIGGHFNPQCLLPR